MPKPRATLPVRFLEAVYPSVAANHARRNLRPLAVLALHDSGFRPDAIAAVLHCDAPYVRRTIRDHRKPPPPSIPHPDRPATIGPELPPEN